MTIEVGNRIRLSGGYDFEPQWLGGRSFVEGRVTGWVPGQNEEPACVVLLDDTLSAEGLVHGDRREVTGRHVVLQLRYRDAQWENSGVVHVELCESMPQQAAWPDRAVGAWVESHASYEVV